jgi:hypothetical protein
MEERLFGATSRHQRDAEKTTSGCVSSRMLSGPGGLGVGDPPAPFHAAVEDFDVYAPCPLAADHGVGQSARQRITVLLRL